jgi:hypothetical protein
MVSDLQMDQLQGGTDWQAGMVAANVSVQPMMDFAITNL